MNKKLCFILSLLTLVLSACHPSKNETDSEEEAFQEYCLMNATETYDFTLPGSLTVTDLQGQSVRHHHSRHLQQSKNREDYSAAI